MGQFYRNLGFTSYRCSGKDTTCRNRNIGLVVVSFLLFMLVGYWILNSQRPKIIMDKKGHIDLTKLWIYSVMIGLIGPLIILGFFYFS